MHNSVFSLESVFAATPELISTLHSVKNSNFIVIGRVLGQWLMHVVEEEEEEEEQELVIERVLLIHFIYVHHLTDSWYCPADAATSFSPYHRRNKPKTLSPRYIDTYIYSCACACVWSLSLARSLALSRARARTRALSLSLSLSVSPKRIMV